MTSPYTYSDTHINEAAFAAMTGSLPPLALTPQAWLEMLPAIVAQLEPEQHEEFVIKTLKEFDRAGAEIGGCLVNEWW